MNPCRCANVGLKDSQMVKGLVKVRKEMPLDVTGGAGAETGMV